MTQAKLGTYGERVTGIEEDRQTVLMMCGTQRRSVPHSPDLGVDWLGIIDRPMPDALRILSLQIDQQFRLHAPHLEFRGLDFVQDVSAMAQGKQRVRVLWRKVGDSAEQETTVG